MKKLLTVLVVVAITISTVTAINVFAATSQGGITELPIGVYPESEHDYPNDFYHAWIYTHPEEADGLFITFSEETSLDKEEHYVETEEISRVTYDEIFFQSSVQDPWNIHRIYYGNELSGKTIYIPGNQFAITLDSDSEGTDYGFSFDRISDTPPENEVMIRYHLSDPETVDFYDFPGDGEKIVRYTYATKKPSYAFCGWSDTVGGEAKYHAWDTIEADGSVDLYAVWEKLIIDAEDAFSFRNSFVGSTPPAEENYYMTDKDYDMMISNLFKTFGIGPVPAPIIAAVLSTYPSWNHTGSCYGMSASVFLQYHGAVDFLEWNDAEKMSDIELTGDVISAVNYYQAQSASSFLCENLAPFSGTAMYSEQLENMYETVKNGEPVLFSFYKQKYLIESGHAVVLTGAFEDANGNKFLVSYDSNYDYTKGECSYYRISPDYSVIYECHDYPHKEGEEITGFNWTADYEQFSSFDINGNGNPLVWYKVFFGHIFYWMQTVFSAAFGS